MKKIIISFIALAMAMSMQAFDLKGLLGGSKTDDSSNSGGGLGDIIGGVVGSLIGNSNFNVDDLVGTWTYKSPAVTLDSDNALQKIGGAAGASVIEGKLEGYYNKLGFNKMTLTVDADHKFTMKIGKATLSGMVEKDEENGLVFNFSVLNKINVGKVKTMAEKAGNNLSLTFDVSGLKKILQVASGISGSAAVQGASSLLNSYDGLYAGFRLAKQ